MAPRLRSRTRTEGNVGLLAPLPHNALELVLVKAGGRAARGVCRALRDAFDAVTV